MSVTSARTSNGRLGPLHAHARTVFTAHGDNIEHVLSHTHTHTHGPLLCSSRPRRSSLPQQPPSAARTVGDDARAGGRVSERAGPPVTRRELVTKIDARPLTIPRATAGRLAEWTTRVGPALPPGYVSYSSHGVRRGENSSFITASVRNTPRRHALKPRCMYGRPGSARSLRDPSAL